MAVVEVAIMGVMADALRFVEMIAKLRVMTIARRDVMGIKRRK